MVTGASRGLGLALVRALVAQGRHVVVDARDGAALREAVGPLGDAVTAVPGDVRDPGHRQDLRVAVERVRARSGPLDLLVHNAGALGPSPLPHLADAGPDDLRDVLDANVVAPVALTALLLPGLRAVGGTVVAVSSDAAVEAYPGWGVYAASKAALERACAVLGAEEPDVRVLVVDPGDMRTRMHADAFPGEDIADRPLPESVVPSLLALLASPAAGGRHRLADVPVLTARAAGTS